MLCPFPDIFNRRSLPFYAKVSFRPIDRTGFVPELRMNAFFICPVKTISTDSFLFGQPVCQSSKLPMECSELIQGMDFMLAFSSTNFPRSADDMKGFLALGYSLKRACLNVSQSGKVSVNSGKFSQSSLSSSVRYRVDCARCSAGVSCAAPASDS